MKKMVITPFYFLILIHFFFLADGKLDDDLGVGSVIRGEVLTVRQEMIVVVLRAAGRKQLAYIPSQCHMNDLMLDLKRYKVGKTSKMAVQA